MNKIYFKIQDPDYGFLSNFFVSPFVDDLGKSWRTVEHFYQSHKTLDELEGETIRRVWTPKEAKHLGKGVTLRSDWNRVKEDVMREALLYKFSNKVLRIKLLETRDAELLEWAPWDCYWGTGRYLKGKNRLGCLLMDLRNDLEYFKYD